MKKLMLTSVLTTVILALFAQPNTGIPGNFSGYINSVSTGKSVIITAKELTDPALIKQKPKKDQPTPFLHMPLDTKNVVLPTNGFTSWLICYGTNAVKWKKELGKSNNSTPALISKDISDNIYVGENNQDGVFITRYDKSGGEMWKRKLEGMSKINRIVPGGSEMVMVVVTDQQKKEPILLKLNFDTGALIEKTEKEWTKEISENGNEDAKISSIEKLCFTRNSGVLRVDTKAETTEKVLMGKVIKGLTYDEQSLIALYERDGYCVEKLDWSSGEKKEIKKQLKALPVTATDVYLLKNEIGGVTAIFNHNNLFGMLKLNKNLVQILKRVNVNSSSYFDVVSSVSIDNSGNMTFVGVNQLKNNKRRIVIAQKSREGK